jgi:hypothetical protein
MHSNLRYAHVLLKGLAQPLHDVIGMTCESVVKVSCITLKIHTGLWCSIINCSSTAHCMQKSGTQILLQQKQPQDPGSQIDICHFRYHCQLYMGNQHARHLVHKFGAAGHLRVSLCASKPPCQGWNIPCTQSQVVQNYTGSSCRKEFPDNITKP